MMSLIVHFKSQKWNALLAMNNYATRSLKHVAMLVGVNHLDLQPCSSEIQLLLSYHLMLQVWYNPWIREQLLHSKFSMRRSFWNGFSLDLILLLVTRT